MSARLTYTIGFIITLIILATSGYLQFFSGIEPCPLCTLQRFAFIALAIFFLLGILLHAKRWGRLLVNSFTTFFSLIGIYLAGRQIWLQHYPGDNGGECGVNLQYMLEVLPIHQVLQKIIFEGSAECTQRGGHFLYLNIAEWSFIWFILFFSMSVYLFLKEFTRKRVLR